MKRIGSYYWQDSKEKVVNDSDFQRKVIHATKWSTITEIAAKLVSPITNMILARILLPEAFGVVATITMIISFAEMFTDSGFQKYLVQHDFKDEDEKCRYANISFWTNLVLAIIIWSIIVVFRDQLASLVGNPGLGNVIVIACLQLPLTSFSSIQMALYRRAFDFETLFKVRIVAICMPFFITIPLALIGLNYWALIIGALAIQLFNAFALTAKSKWKPKFYFNIKELKEMLSFSVWSLIEAISIWLTSWVDVFIIGSVLTQHYLGIYKTSISMVNMLMAIITNSVTPILFSSLSRLQDDKAQFNYVYLKFERLASIFIFPLGIGIYLYSDLATRILLGSKWAEASDIIGIWALTSAFMIVFGHFSSEVYRSKGKPKLSFFAQILHLIALVPVCLISSTYGFWPLVYSRSLIRFHFVLVHLFIMKFSIGFPVFQIFKTVFPAFVSAIVMGVIGYFLKQVSRGITWDFISIAICIVSYFAVLFIFPKIRKEIFRTIGTIGIR